MSGPSDWTEMRVDAPLGWHELVGEALSLGPCTSVVFGTTSIAAAQPPPGHEAVRTFVAAADDGPALRNDVRRRLAALAASTGAAELSALEPRFKALPREDYATSWRKDWRPFRVGRLALLPPWRDEPPPRATDVRLTIEPGGSFGSGRHATTRTCLRVLSERIAGGERVLDAGTGSGILSVAALLLGARSALGFDIDPGSARSASELARGSGVAEHAYSFRTGDFGALEDHETGFDLVCANIYADVLSAEADNLTSRLAPTGWFLFSGCRYDHRPEAVRAFEDAGLLVEDERRRGRWITFVGRRA
ncbi:MAG: 50S ribosomal protein L11 methyltransferase [Planctomycetota bacterium]